MSFFNVIGIVFLFGKCFSIYESNRVITRKFCVRGVIKLKIDGSRIIVAADFDQLDPAVKLAELVGPEVFGIKVGSEFAEAVGAPQAVEAITTAGSKVFRDLKTYDIKNTDVKTMVAAVRPGVTIINMHALNGDVKMKASADAVRARAKELGIPAPLVLAVTILTDNDWDDLRKLGFFANYAEFPVTFTGDQIAKAKKDAVRQLVVHLAGLAKEAGLDGVIASPQEATLIRKACGANFVIATPGIRPANAPPDDQKRTLTPREAIEAGADLLVVGRPITSAGDPLAVVRQFNADIAEALTAMQIVFERPNWRVVVPVRRSDEEYLSVLKSCGGYYNVPMVSDQPCGQLVAYSGRYLDGDRQLQYVGFRYFNLATLEQFPHAAELFACGLAEAVRTALSDLDCIVGVPDGGTIIGHNTARHLDVMFVGLQKKVVALATETSKEQTKLTLGRHDIESGMRAGITEDLVNNFSTTDKAIEVVEATGAKVVGIICGLNRSDKTEFNGLPVISLVHLPTPQYRQDDPAVAPFIEKPGVVWDVKPNWPSLLQVMAEHATRSG